MIVTPCEIVICDPSRDNFNQLVSLKVILLRESYIPSADCKIKSQDNGSKQEPIGFFCGSSMS